MGLSDPIELSTVAGLTVLSVEVSANAARILSAEHALPADSSLALAVGQAVRYTDPDLGLVFLGRVVSRDRRYSRGEGITYQCADAWRELEKTAATVEVDEAKTCKLLFEVDTELSAALAVVLSSADAILPGGLNLTGGGTIPALDRGGAFMAAWIDDLLNQTTGDPLIALVEYVGGQPSLTVRPYTSAQTVSLRVGTYNVIAPRSGDLLLTEGTSTESLNEKYRKLVVEGAGVFKRWRARWIQCTYPTPPTTEEFLSGVSSGPFKFYPPEGGRIISRYIEDGVVKDGLRAIILVEGSLGAPLIIENPPYFQNDGAPYFWLPVGMPCHCVDAACFWPRVDAWFDYTAYTGPLTAEVESEEAGAEGELWEVHEEFFKYEDPEVPENEVDLTPEALAVATARFSTRGGVDKTGSLGVYVCGLNADLQIGSPVENFDGRRVRSIRYDIVKRGMMLDLASGPLRESVQRAKATARARRADGTRNWAASSREVILESGAFAGWRSLNSDPAKLASPSEVMNAKLGIQTWECYQGQCRGQTGEELPYRTLEECRKVCRARSWDKFGGLCIARNDEHGQYPTWEACQESM
jgi:hypothetical protein